MSHRIYPRPVLLGLAAPITCALITALSAVPSLRAQDVTSQRITVTAEPVATPHPHDDTRPKLEHIMREVSETQITVTKKASVIRLDKEAPFQGNNNQELFTKAPGLVVSEQQNPGQFNYSYRGLGNPQESEYTLFLQDGLPMMAEWIGFPTLYYQPVPQSISEIQFIRGGSSLLYGPEPAPAINFVTKHPVPGTPWSGFFEQTGGANGFYNTYASVQEAQGSLEFRMDADYQTSDGQRDNGWYDLWQANGYLGYRPSNNQLIAFDVHLSRFNGGDPGKLTLAQFENNQDFATTPYNENWVDRYNFVLRYEVNLSEDWLMQAKGWFTHQDIDARSAANLGPVTSLNPMTFPTSTTFGYEEFNNGGIDLRFRKKWGAGTMFKGSALTFGGVAYHGEAPFTRYTLNNNPATPLAFYGPNFLYAPRGATSGSIPLLQDRTADYQAFFIEDLIRIGSFHIVPSFRLDHENVEVNSTYAPWLPNPTVTPPITATTGPASISADHWVPLWGIGLGNDFGKGNETYFSATTGWRPTRFFDIAGTSRTIQPGQPIPDPFNSLDIELGVHGTPVKGLWYDVGLFWMEFENRTENVNIAGSSTLFFVQNTGNTRHRGIEAEFSYDLLAPFQHDIEPASTTKDPKSGKDVSVVSEPSHPLQLIVFSNFQFLDAEFTESELLVPGTTRTFVGNTPNYAPEFIWKGGITFQKEKCFRVTLSGVHVADQFWADNNLGNPAVPTVASPTLVPAIIPSYTVWNLSSEWHLTKNLRLIAGVSNLADEKYYSRVFLNGLIDPAPRRTGYAGLSVEF